MSRFRFLTVLLSVCTGFVCGVYLTQGDANESNSTIPARGYYKAGDFTQCLTHDRTMWAANLGLPKSELNKYLDRKDKTKPPTDKYLKYLEWKVKRNDFNMIKFPFSKSYLCPGLSKGHALKGSKVCQLWTGLKTAGVIKSDNGGMYCEFEPGGGGIAAQPVVVCKQYGKTKLGFNMEETSTFVRWNGTTYDAVCFYIDRLDVEATLKVFSEKIKKEFVHPYPDKKKITQRVTNRNSGWLMEKIYKDNDSDYTVEIPFATPLVGKRIAELAKIDPKLATKYADWISGGIHHETVMWGKTRGRNQKSAIGHGYNTRLYKSALKEISDDRKMQRAMVEHWYNNYAHEKDAAKKKIEREIYENNTKYLNAINNVESAVDELYKKTQKKEEAAEAETERKRRSRVKNGLKSLLDLD